MFFTLSMEKQGQESSAGYNSPVPPRKPLSACAVRYDVRVNRGSTTSVETGPPGPSSGDAAPAAAIVRDLAGMCGQLLCVGFDGPSAPPELLGRIARSEVGTVILFRPNVQSPAQLADLVTTLRTAAPADLPLVVAVDQEGGLVQRVRAPATEWPPMMSVAAAGDPGTSRAVGQALGEELRLFGIGWDFAPVLDVHTNPENPVIGNRAFGTTAAEVEAHALAFWEGLRAAGVRGCGKHFPGHGDTELDSHHDLPLVRHDLARLRAVELAPFAAAIAAGAEALMTAHVVYPALDPDRPATLSPRIATGLLRDELGFTGLLVSDDLGMRAVADRWPIEEIVRQGVLAGIDHFILRGPPERQVNAWAGLLAAATADADVRRRVEQSYRRVLAFKAAARVPMPVSADELARALPNAGHQALAVRLREGTTGTDSGPAASPVAGD
jgi:beta-N-acetylhexosaminidase